tara:strand:+ start:49 stop:297 length:249 start_codon:yes stop_codon:yes gene_type:complete
MPKKINSKSKSTAAREQYDHEFAQAMKIKLELNRQQRKSQGSDQSVNQRGPFDRQEEINKLMTNNPGLSQEKAEQGLRELGF